MNGKGNFLPTLLALIVVFDFVHCFRDDWYSFGSFEDTNEWSDIYTHTCGFHTDLFREPREFSRRNSLKGRREAHTPIRFRTKTTIRAPENVTLHIYNNPGIRRGYSVSYGFQRNKECLHGQDSECVVNPELGRVRALVINADRFGQQKSLNFLKDHFLIERPEQFVTILNGGSQFERKFYEAVFLGGYNNHDLRRSSHQIDGKTYPLEIYMYFLDETVPSVSLSTILVVLVEESEQDNVQIRPIIDAVEHGLYDAERRFLDRNAGMIRRERLYHHLEGSIYYNYDTSAHKHKWNEHIVIQKSLDPSVVEEATVARYIEPFEKMQALEAEMFFLLEDLNHLKESLKANDWFMHEFEHRHGNTLFPANFTEFQLMAIAVVFRSYRREFKNYTCEEFSDAMFVKDQIWTDIPGVAQFQNVSKLPTGAHLTKYAELVAKICKHFDESFTDIFKSNKNGAEMVHLSFDDKYDLVQDFVVERKIRNGLNMEVYDHYADPSLHPYGPGDEIPVYANEQQKYEVVTGIYKLIQTIVKTEDYLKILQDTKNAIEHTALRLDYLNADDMQNVIQYLKHGSKQNDLKHNRAKIFDDVRRKTLPSEEKKKSLVEYGGMEISEEDIDRYEKLTPVKVTVDQPFQISWLIPQDGGYYYYAGSSPLPPCFRAQNVIVFKKPIRMTKRQIKALTRVPTSFDREEDIIFTTPHVHDSRFEVPLIGSDTEESRVEEITVRVYHQPRNHLFLGHDGIHKNAVELWEMISKERKLASRAASLEKTLIGSSILFVMIIQLNI